MCGIAGIVSENSRLDKYPLVKRMADSLRHRGPDGYGYWINSRNQVAFGHRRLSIIDLSDNGRQPMHFGNERYTIVYNGEIYNYLEIRSLLLNENVLLKSKCDTEVILGLYALKGTNCLQYLNGMFSFAIWDDQEQTLFCARDRFGEKPFFYYHDQGKTFYFASEMKAIWSVGIRKDIDESKLFDYIESNSLESEDQTSTFYKKIKQLNNGHFILLKNLESIEQVKYYSLDDIQVNCSISESTASEQLLRLLTESVTLRLRSDVPVGSSLSGGLDSSSIVMLIDKIRASSEGQNSFSARFKDFDRDEGFFIDKVVSACKNLANHEVWPTHEEMEQDIKEIIYHQEEPFSSSSVFAQWKVMQVAKENNVTVLLDGQGADEYMAGYLSYYSIYLNELFYKERSDFRRELKEYNTLRYPQVFKQHQTIRQRLGRRKRQLLGKNVPYATGSLKNQLKKDMLSGNLKVLLRYADRNSMAHSREVRLPFLDHRLVEFVFGLPDSFILKNGWTKWILRQCMSDALPKEVVWRVDKVGFEPPESKWLANLVTSDMRRKVDEFFRDQISENIILDNFSLKPWDVYMISQMVN